MRTGTIIRRILAALLVTAVVWCVVVFWWQAGDVSPGVGDLVLWLLVLPVVLVGGYWLWRWWRDRRGQAEPEPEAPKEDDGLSDAPPPDRVLQVRAVALQLRAGASADEVLAQLADPQRPGLHPTLRDAAGLPVYAAPVEGIDGELLREPLLAVAAEPDAIDRLLTDEVLRAFALLQPVAEEVLLAARPTVPAQAPIEDGLSGRDGLHPHAMAHSRSVQADAPVPTATPLQVRLLLPASWHASLRDLAARWLRGQARALGYRDGQLVVGVLPAGGPLDVWRVLDQICEASHVADAGSDETHLILATDSLIGEASIERLDARSRLLSSGRAEGLIPGEGAAGLWLAPDSMPTTPAAPRLHRPLLARTATIAGHRAAVRRAGALLQRTAEATAVPLGEVAVLLSDADHRPSRSVEVAGAANAALPELDPDTCSLSLGVPCGELGAVAPLALIAVAAAMAADRQAPVLALGVGADEQRVALLMSPPGPVATTPDSESAQAPTTPSATPEPANTADA